MRSDQFVGREAQVRSLRGFFERPPRSKITAIHGRRRIGKTRLVREAYRDARLLSFEGLEGAGSAEQRKHFRNTLYRHSGLESHRIASASDWTDLLLLLLAEYVKQEPCVLFFDEFPWMAAGRTELVSKLKYVWDQVLAQEARVHLVLCGSVSSFLVDKVIRSRALYGRIDEVIELGPLGFHEVAPGFFGRRSTLEAPEYYLAFGGVPRYLELHDDRRSIPQNLSELCFRPGAYFLDELDRLFVSHFGKVRHYRDIVELLARRGFATRPQIGGHLGLDSGGRLSELLDDLCLAGLVEPYSPVHNPTSTYLRRFRIRDPFLRFYGLAFEHFCGQHAGLIARKVAALSGFPQYTVERVLISAFRLRPISAKRATSRRSSPRTISWTTDRSDSTFSVGERRVRVRPGAL